jgi:hypothetical protein
MTRWEALTTICDYLRAGLLGGKRRPKRDIVWPLMIEVSSFHYVTPTLAGCLKGGSNVPSDVREYFDTMATRNAQRNEMILAGLARIAGLLNAIDIEPVFSRGRPFLSRAFIANPRSDSWAISTS